MPITFLVSKDHNKNKFIIPWQNTKRSWSLILCCILSERSFLKLCMPVRFVAECISASIRVSVCNNLCLSTQLWFFCTNINMWTKPCTCVLCAVCCVQQTLYFRYKLNIDFKMFALVFNDFRSTTHISTALRECCCCR